MVWPLTSQKEADEIGDVSMATRDAWNNIPPTPGAATWALKAIPTIFFGTPKPKENDDIFKDITNSLDAAASNIPSTPVVGDQNRPGILKTPGTQGPPKNVSFAHLSLGSESDTELSMSPSMRKSSSKIERIRSGLPANFPGKFPSPWTPKVVDHQHYHEDSESQAQINDNQRQTQTDSHSRLPSAEEPIIMNPEKEATVDSIVQLILENNQKLEQLTVSSSDSGSTGASVNTAETNMYMNYEQLIAELKQQTDYAIDYARMRDKEVIDFRAQLAELMEENASLMAKSAEQHQHYPVAEPLNDNISSGSSDLQNTQLELEKVKTELNLIKNDYNKLNSLNEELDRENSRLKSNNSSSLSLQKTNETLRKRVLELEQRSSAGNVPDLDDSSNKENELQTQIAILKESESAGQRRNDEISRKLEDAESEAKSHLRRITSLEATNENLKKQLENPRVDYQKSLLEGQVQDLEHQLVQAREKLESQQAQIQTLQRQRETTSNDMTRHAQALVKKVSEKDREISDYRRKIDELQESVDQLKRQLSSNGNSSSGLQSQQIQTQSLLSNSNPPVQTSSSLQQNETGQGKEKDGIDRAQESNKSPLNAATNSPKRLSLQRVSLFKNSPSPASSSSSSSAAPVKDKQYPSSAASSNQYTSASTYPGGAMAKPAPSIFDDIIDDYKTHVPMITSPVDRAGKQFNDAALSPNNAANGSSRFDISMKDVTMKDVSLSQSSFEVLGDSSKVEATKARLNDPSRYEASMRRLAARRANGNSSRASSEMAF